MTILFEFFYNTITGAVFYLYSEIYGVSLANFVGQLATLSTTVDGFCCALFYSFIMLRPKGSFCSLQSCCLCLSPCPPKTSNYSTNSVSEDNKRRGGLVSCNSGVPALALGGAHMVPLPPLLHPSPTTAGTSSRDLERSGRQCCGDTIRRNDRLEPPLFRPRRFTSP